MSCSKDPLLVDSKCSTIGRELYQVCINGGDTAVEGRLEALRKICCVLDRTHSRRIAHWLRCRRLRRRRCHRHRQLYAPWKVRLFLLAPKYGWNCISEIRFNCCSKDETSADFASHAAALGVRTTNIVCSFFKSRMVHLSYVQSWRPK